MSKRLYLYNDRIKRGVSWQSDISYNITPKGNFPLILVTNFAIYGSQNCMPMQVLLSNPSVIAVAWILFYVHILLCTAHSDFGCFTTFHKLRRYGNMTSLLQIKFVVRIAGSKSFLFEVIFFSSLAP